MNSVKNRGRGLRNRERISRRGAFNAGLARIATFAGSGADVWNWSFSSFCRAAEFGRDQGIADIEEPSSADSECEVRHSVKFQGCCAKPHKGEEEVN